MTSNVNPGRHDAKSVNDMATHVRMSQLASLKMHSKHVSGQINYSPSSSPFDHGLQDLIVNNVVTCTGRSLCMLLIVLLLLGISMVRYRALRMGAYFCTRPYSTLGVHLYNRNERTLQCIRPSSATSRLTNLHHLGITCCDFRYQSPCQKSV